MLGRRGHLRRHGGLGPSLEGSERPAAQPTSVDCVWNELALHLKGFKGRAPEGVKRSRVFSSTQGMEDKAIPKASSVPLCVPGDLAGKDRASFFFFFLQDTVAEFSHMCSC